MIKSRLGGVYETQQNWSLVIGHWSLVISYLLEITKDIRQRTKHKNVGWVETFLLLSLSKYGTSPRETQHPL